MVITIVTIIMMVLVSRSDGHDCYNSSNCCCLMLFKID